jgi:adenylate cyclase
MLSNTACYPVSFAATRSEVDLEFQEGCSPAEVRAELRRILASPQFEASERNRRFLEYVIEETLAGRAGRIKAYNIATEVFGRDVNFDPQLDPVVRMEARRLRRSLERFYLTDGRSSRIRIAMPKGGYVPEFSDTLALGGAATSQAPRPDAGEAILRSRGPSIAIARFDAEGDESIFVHFNHGFTDQILVGLCRYPELSVFGAGPLSRNPQMAELDLDGDASVDFVLTGSTALFEGALDVKAVLLQARTGKVLWGQSFERRLEPGKMIGLRDEIANAIVRAVAEPFGFLSRCGAEAAPERSSEWTASTHALARFYQYRTSYRRDLFDQVRRCLEQAMTACPEDSEATACLAQVYTDAHRFGFAASESPAALRQQAAMLARRAVELDPNSARGHHAQGVAHWYLGEVAASIRAMQTAVTLNPNACEVVADLGLLWSLRGDWDQAVPLLEAARQRTTAYSSAWHTGLSLYDFANGRFEDALANALEIDTPDVAHGFAARAISQIRLGCKAEAKESVERIIALTAPRGRGVLAELGGRNLNADLSRRVSAGLRDAGLPKELVGE